MAIAKMTKVMVVSHRTQAAELLEEIQRAGVMQILDAGRAMVSKEWPELQTETARYRDVEELLAKLDGSIAFLKKYTDAKDLPGALKPLMVVGQKQYSDVVSDKDALDTLEKVQQCQECIEQKNSEIEHIDGVVASLEPWKELDVDVEEIRQRQKSNILAGIISKQNFEGTIGEIQEQGAVVEVISQGKTYKACLVVCLNENATAINKILRAGDFETANFDGMAGKAKDIIAENLKELAEKNNEIEALQEQAKELSVGRIGLQILFEHYQNLYDRKHTQGSAPATSHAVLLEGWIREKDYPRLEKIVARFDASSVGTIELGEDEEIPFEIENNKVVKPFETITRLHGMPNVGDVDPTVFLAPFFALFFGICLTDAGYGIIMAIAFWWLIKKIQGDKKALWMLVMCSITSIVAGALTGGWFGDAIQTMIPQETAVFRVVNGLRVKLMLFDPMKDPMTFFLLAIGLGYLQIMFAICIGFVNKLLHKDYATAVFNHLTWLIFLNSLLLFGLGKAQVLPSSVGVVCGWIAMSQAVLIFFFSERKSGLAGRLGGGVFALFSTVFYFGDVLSYVRLMALGMVTAGLGMAVNILVKLVMEVPYVGFILGAILFVGGHLLNLALSLLSAFVHSLRLQFVEFFPKFFVGGGREFKPLSLLYRYVLIKTKDNVV